MKRFAVIMAGGSGQRLWPLSRKKSPKQFTDILGQGVLLNNTIARLKDVINIEDIMIVAAEHQREILFSVVDNQISKENIIFEPIEKNTAACIALAAKHIEQEEESVMCIVPADHYVENDSQFQATLYMAIDAAIDYNSIVTIGITPTHASTGYGYIKVIQSLQSADNTFLADRFVEKPDIELAQKYIDEGNHYWNSGIFITKTSVMLNNIKMHQHAIYDGICQAHKHMKNGNKEEALKAYTSLPALSIDYAVMEKSKELIVVPGEFGWSDVGSFDAIHDIVSKDENGNAIISGKCIAIDSHNTTLHSKKLVTMLGINDIVIIDTNDVLFLCRADRAQDIKQIVEQLRSSGFDDFL